MRLGMEGGREAKRIFAGGEMERSLFPENRGIMEELYLLQEFVSNQSDSPKEVGSQEYAVLMNALKKLHELISPPEQVGGDGFFNGVYYGTVQATQNAPLPTTEDDVSIVTRVASMNRNRLLLEREAERRRQRNQIATRLVSVTEDDAIRLGLVSNTNRLLERREAEEQDRERRTERDREQRREQDREQRRERRRERVTERRRERVTELRRGREHPAISRDEANHRTSSQ